MTVAQPPLHLQVLKSMGEKERERFLQRVEGKRVCWNCAYAHHEWGKLIRDPGFVRCGRYAPRAAEHVRHQYPYPHGTDWCGEWKDGEGVIRMSGDGSEAP